MPFEGTLRWAPGVRLGYVPQKLDIARDAPIAGFDFLRAKAALSRTQEATAFRELDTVGLPPEAAAQPIGTLSGGQFQRLFTIALGLRYLGVLLMGSLIIFPAATAQRLSKILNHMLIVAVAIAVTTTVGGSWLALWIHQETGPSSSRSRQPASF